MEDLQITAQPFAELSNEDLYAILRLRSEVFVVEQDCVYPDLDDLDQQAWHVFGKRGGEIVCYARLLAAGARFPCPSIGRVVTAASVRRDGLGRRLMAVAIERCQQQWPDQGITISAQRYLEQFYQGFGFRTVSAPYQEDGIPHIRMQLDA